jgi:hypothetical protein
MFPPYSPFLKRASSFPNIACNGDAVYPSGDSLLSPRISPYDPFAYFLGHPTGSRRSSDVSPSRESFEKKEDGIQNEEKEKVKVEVEAMEEDQNSNEGNRKYDLAFEVISRPGDLCFVSILMHQSPDQTRMKCVRPV